MSDTVSSEVLRVQDSGNGIFSVLINRPEQRNPLSLSTLDAIGDTFSGIAERKDLKLAIIRGAGDRSFAAGGDLKELAALTEKQQARAMSERGRRALDAIRYCPIPVVAAVNGDAIGGGGELAMACDFRVLAAHARIAFLQGRLNISTGWGGGTDVLQKLGPVKGLEVICRKEWIGGDRALLLGVANAVAIDDETMDDALERFIAPMLEQVPQVLRTYKALAIAQANAKPRDAIEHLETSLFAENWVHPDHWEAVEKIFPTKKK